MPWSHLANASLMSSLLFLFSCQNTYANIPQEKVRKEILQIQKQTAACGFDSKIHPVVAVIDTGIDLTHPDLAGALWKNPGEIPNNGKDDDGNGFIDDIHGWNFSQDNNQLQDVQGHGSHVSGIIASQNRDGRGVQGIAPCARLMVLKYFDAKQSPQQNLIHTLQALNYAVRMGADIINYSGGGPGKNPMEESLIREASEKNILLVAAAGNEGVNTDLNPYYPAGYNLPNIFSVTAISGKGSLPYYGNFGKKSVNIAAPGDGIYSTLPQGFGEMSGTSQATAFVTGGAVLALAETRAQGLTLRPPELIERIVATSLVNEKLRGKTKSGAELSLYRSIAMKDAGVSASGLAIVNTFSLNAELFTVSP